MIEELDPPNGPNERDILKCVDMVCTHSAVSRGPRGVRKLTGKRRKYASLPILLPTVILVSSFERYRSSARYTAPRSRRCQDPTVPVSWDPLVL